MKVQNPLPCIFASLSLSSILFVMQIKNKWLALFWASLFLFICLKWINKKFVFILIIFFAIGVINIANYFNYYPSMTEVVRIDEVRDGYSIGSINKRRVYLFYNKDVFKEGEIYKISGEFTAKKGFFNGTIGSIEVSDYNKEDDDYYTKIVGTREKVFLKIKDKIGSRKAALITSISFGYTRYIDYEDKENMGRLGLLHIIAVSGLHMGIVFSILKRIIGIKGALILSLLYVIFTGCAVSTIRAYIMLVCISIAIPLRRNYNKHASLAIAGIIIMLFKPYAIFSVGFLLSFTATLGIMTFNKMINKKLYKLPKFLRESLAISISSQIFSLPILIYYFNEITINFIIGNLVLAPIIMFVVIIGNLIVISIPFIMVFDYLSYIGYNLIKLMDWVLDIVSNVSLDNIVLSKKIALVYITFLISIYFYKKSYKFVVMLPVFTFIFSLISIYSINPKITYLYEGALLISYRGNREAIILKSNVDIKKVKEKYNVNKINRDCRKFTINNEYVFIEQDGNYVTNIGDNAYLLKVNYKKVDGDYDIIDFKDGTFSEVIILNDKILENN